MHDRNIRMCLSYGLVKREKTMGSLRGTNKECNIEVEEDPKR